MHWLKFIRIGHRLPLTGLLQGGIFDELDALFVFLDYVCQTFRCIEFLTIY